jgi:sec-independent protein translocase protein TatC
VSRSRTGPTPSADPEDRTDVISASGVLRLFRVKPQHPVSADGRMALADHLRELRARLLTVVLVLVAGTVVAWFFYDFLFSLILDPYNDARERLEAKGVKTEPVISGVASSLLLRLKISALAAVIATSPIWLYQIWAFIVPGLHPNEKRWTQLFTVVAGPLFVAGVAVAYYVLPKGMEVLIGFTPSDIQSLIEFDKYLSFIIRMMLVFGIAFEIPLFVVMLNLAGVIRGATLGAYRPWIVVGTFIFAAVATPSTDPFSMVMLAVPMSVLFLVSEGIARLIDKRRAARGGHYDGLDDDVASPLDHRVDDVRASRLDEDD